MFSIIPYQPNQTLAIRLARFPRWFNSSCIKVICLRFFCLTRKIPRVCVYRRINTEGICARGIFPGAQVVRGPDWEYGDTDGNSSGTVTNITCWRGSNAIAVHVLWEVGTKGTYRLGPDGKVG